MSLRDMSADLGFVSRRLAALRSAVEQQDWDVQEGQLLLPPHDTELSPFGCNVLEVMLHGERVK
jgi:hypothetical protein